MRSITRVFILIGALAAVAACVWAFRPNSKSPIHDTNESAALVAPKTQSLTPETNSADGGSQGSSGLEVTGAPARHSELRSPLESSPGYYPPDDPESLSVITGRREAPAVDLELSDGFPSLDALGRQIVSGIERGDPWMLHSSRVTLKEFETIIWPELPQSRPITHIPVREVWGMSTAQSLAGVNRTIGAYGGRHLAFLRVDYGHEEPFRNFSLLRDVRILIRDPRDPGLVGLTVMPSVVVRHGSYKALIFKD